MTWYLVPPMALVVFICWALWRPELKPKIRWRDYEDWKRRRGT